MELKNIKVTQAAVAKLLRVNLHVRDEFCCKIFSDKGNVLKEQEDGYVPAFMPKDHDGNPHYGDYVYLDIDLDTGQILNWSEATPARVERFINDEDEQD